MKKVLFLLLALVLAIGMVACANTNNAADDTATPTEEAVANAFTIAIEGADKTEITQSDLTGLDQVTIEATKTKKDGSSSTDEYTGVLISDVLTWAGVTDYTTITLTASDGYAADITKDMLSDKAIFATAKNGEAFTADDGYVMSVLEGQGGNVWVAGIVTIKIS